MQNAESYEEQQLKEEQAKILKIFSKILHNPLV